MLEELNSSLTTEYSDKYMLALEKIKFSHPTSDALARNCRLAVSSACTQGHLALDAYIKALRNGISPTTATVKLGRAIAIRLYVRLYTYHFATIDKKSFAKRKGLTGDLMKAFMPEITAAIAAGSPTVRKLPGSSSENVLLFGETSKLLGEAGLKEAHLKLYGGLVYHTRGQKKERVYQVKNNRLEEIIPTPSAASLSGNVVDIQAVPSVMEEAREKAAVEKSVLGMYREWCQKSDFVPADHPLTFFSSDERISSSSLSSSRSWLKKEGFEFEKVEGGYKVTKRPGLSSDQKKELAEALKTIEKFKNLIEGFKP